MNRLIVNSIINIIMIFFIFSCGDDAAVGEKSDKNENDVMVPMSDKFIPTYDMNKHGRNC